MVQQAIDANAKSLWDNCRQLIQKEVQPWGRVSMRKYLSGAQDNLAEELCRAVENQFCFKDVANRLKI